MANIALLNRCNLRCPYCFADGYLNDDSTDISIKAFTEILDFCAPDGEIGIIGGEPLLHKDFDTLMDIAANDFRLGKITVFTNGIFIDKHINALLNRKTTVLINVNSTKDIGKSNFEKIDKNIGVLLDAGHRGVSLGINVYENGQDFSDFIYLIKKYGFKKIRLSVVIPKDKTIGGIKYFSKMKPTLFSLYKELLRLDVMPYYDCNAIPECVYTKDELEILNALPFTSQFEREIFTGARSVCSPVIDIYPDKTSTRCFGCFNMARANIEDFDSIADLRNYFFKEIDTRLVHRYHSEKCKDCYKHKVFGCFGGCLCYAEGKEASDK